MNNEEREKESYYKIHKDKYNEKFRCETCGGFYTLINKSHHMKTKKHLYWIDRKDEINELKKEIEKLNKEIKEINEITVIS